MDESSIAKDFGEQLKKLRTQQGISQEKLAHKTGLHPTYISHLETGKKQPTLSTIIGLSKSLNINIAELLSNFIDS